VQIAHQNAAALLQWCHHEWGQTPWQTCLGSTSYTFDMHVFEVFYTLSTGKTLRLIESGLDIINWLDQDPQLLLNTVPSVIEYLLAEKAPLQNVAAINMGGEAIAYYVKEALDFERIEVRNLYGPSEDTTYSSSYRFAHDHNFMVVGKPISNTRFYVLDAHGQLLPQGVPGQLYIAGAGLSLGYLNKEALTEERFTQDPFVPGQKMYATGDLVRWLPDGQLDYQGRLDFQVKIRGYRVETGEIENTLQQHPQVQQVLVNPIKQGNNQHLAAYYLGTELPAQELRNWLRQHLPEFMVPTYVVHLEDFPRTPNGKADRKQLPLPQEQITEATQQAAPQTAVQAQLVQIWQEVLEHSPIGINDNFFDLGGHSLKANRIVGKVLKEMGATLSLRSLFENPTVAQLAAVLESAGTQAFEPIEALPQAAHYPLSFAQGSLYLYNALEEQEHAVSNMPMAVALEGQLNLEALQKAFNAVVNRHESLRTTFKQVNQQPVQVVAQPGSQPLSIVHTKLNSQPNAPQQAQQLAQQESNAPFDLEQGPLMRVHLIEVAAQDYILCITLHHIISDGWSLQQLFEEVMQGYKAYLHGTAPTLPNLPIQYKDYSAWINKVLEGTKGQEWLQWWQNKLSHGQVPVMQLPTDRPRPAQKTSKGQVLYSQIEAPLSQALVQQSRQQGQSLFMWVLAISHALFYKLGQQEDQVLGTTVAGREHPDLEHQIGYYVNVLPLRTQFNGQGTFAQLLEQTRSTVLGAYEAQMYPFDKLLENLDVRRDASRSNLFDVMVKLNNQDDHAYERTLEGMQVKGFTPVWAVSHFDLSLNFMEGPNGINTEWEYNTDLYNTNTMQTWWQYWQRILKLVLANPNIALNDLLLYEGQQLEVLQAYATHLNVNVAQLQWHTDLSSLLANANMEALAKALGQIWGQPVEAHNVQLFASAERMYNHVETLKEGQKPPAKSASIKRRGRSGRQLDM